VKPADEIHDISFGNTFALAMSRNKGPVELFQSIVPITAW
jgi:hypothetical protein